MGDWGNIHFEAATSGRRGWMAHASVCAQCRATEAKQLWKRAHSEPKLDHRQKWKSKPVPVHLTTYGSAPEPVREARRSWSCQFSLRRPIA